MKGKKFENLKNFLLAVLLGIVVSKCFVFQKSSDAFIIGYLVAHVAWVALVAYDELLRKRRYSRQNHKRMASL